MNNINNTKEITKKALYCTITISILIIVLLKIKFYHTESIISIYKFLNPNFLSNDFFVESLLNFHSQYYFVALIGILSKMIFIRPEIILSFIGTFSKILTLYAIYVFGRDILEKKSHLRGLILALLSTISVISLGGWSLLLDFSRPWSFIHPLLIFGILYSFKGKIIKSMTFFGIASIFHPLLGGVLGTVTFASSYISNFIESKNKIIRKIFDQKYILSLLIFFGLFALNLVPAIKSLSGFKLSTSQFIQILANYAHPVHYIPSLWGFKPFIDLVLIISSAAFVFYLLENKSWFNLDMKIFSGIILTLMMCGYLFVEIIPTRIFTSIIGFRYFIFLYLIMLFSFSLFIEENLFKNKRQNIYFILSFLISYFLLQESFAIFLSCITLYLCEKVSKKFSYMFILIPILCIVLFNFNFIFYSGVLILSFVPALLDDRKNKTIIVISKIVIIIILILIVMFSYNAESKYIEENNFKYDISNKITYITDKDSIILAPTKFSMIRTVGKRSLFVGSEFPFLDETMSEWYKRARLAWGENLSSDKYYKSINDDQLLYLNEEYNVTHAILFVETNTNLDEVYRNDKFKIIKI